MRGGGGGGVARIWLLSAAASKKNTILLYDHIRYSTSLATCCAVQRSSRFFLASREQNAEITCFHMLESASRLF